MNTLDTLIVHETIASLTPKQRELARLIMRGHTNRTAAAALGISQRAARARLAGIRSHFRDAA